MSINLCRVAFRGANGGCNAILAPVTSVGFATKFAVTNRRIPPPCQQQRRTLIGGWMQEIKVSKMLDKCNERSKIIVVEGNIACGKSTAAKELADKLGMRHMPEATVQYMPMRRLGHPIEDKFVGDVSLEKFYADPFSADCHTFNFQFIMYISRFLQMVDAIKHVIETAQGVVLERSVYSDFVFMEATHKLGCFGRKHVKIYDELVYNSLYKLIPPHLIIYLDIPADKAMENIKKRGIPMEQDISKTYLQHLEDSYKEKYLPQAIESSKILEYDWTNPINNVERIVEDIELFSEKDWSDIEWNQQSDRTVTSLYEFISSDHAVLQSFYLNSDYQEFDFKPNELDFLMEEYKEKYTPRPKNWKETLNIMLSR